VYTTFDIYGFSSTCNIYDQLVYPTGEYIFHLKSVVPEIVGKYGLR
jgi:hypothetical protein